MKIRLLIVFLTFFAGFANRLFSQDNPATNVLASLSAKLNSISTVSYEYYRSVNYFSENYHHKTAASSYVEFGKDINITGFKYQFEGDQFKMVYNGSESFYLNKDDKTIRITSKPKPEEFPSVSFLVNSVVTLRNAMPEIIADKEITKTLSDTLISDKEYFLVSLLAKDKYMNGLGTFAPVTMPRNFIYKIIIDKGTYLPVQVIQSNNIVPADYMLTSFTNFKFSGNQPPDNSWYYSSYDNEFKLGTANIDNLIKPGAVAPDWKLPLIANSDSLTLSEVKGKVVLLEFWIKNCGYCIGAVPKLNSLIKKYGKKRFEIVGVNPDDTKEDINNFYARTRPDFKTVSDDGKVTKGYGVSGYPTVVLVDKKGEVLYSGDFDKDVLESLIKKALR